MLLLTGPAILPGGLTDAAIVVDGSRIAWAGPRAHYEKEAAQFDVSETVDHNGLILPGLVDLHNHGGGGWSFPDTDHAADAMPAIMEHRKHGTTSVVASLVTAAPDILTRRVRALADLCDRGDLAGIHLEGPFISKDRCGAQDPDFIIAGSAGLTRSLLDAGRGHVVTMTVAPEADESGDVASALIAGGALPSYGHTDCSGALMTESVERARRLISQASEPRSSRPTATHLFNAMRPIHHRDAGPAFASLDAAARSQLVVELIADGVHTSADTVAYTFTLVPDDSLVLITDAMAAAGMADGSYRLGSLDVNVASGVATLASGGAIAGGTAHLIDVVRFAHCNAGVPLERAVAAASAVPARVLGKESEIGSLAAGMRADIVLASDDLRAQRVLHRGEWV